MHRWIPYLIAVGLIWSTAVASEASAISKDVSDSIVEAQNLAAEGNFDAALRELENTLQRSEITEAEQATALTFQASIYYEKGDYSGAIDSYEQILTLTVLDEELRTSTLYMTAQLYLLQEDYETTRDYLDRYFDAKQSPEPDEYVFYAQTLFNLERYVTATKWLTDAINLADSRGEERREDWWQFFVYCLWKTDSEFLKESVEELTSRWPTANNFSTALGIYVDLEDAEAAAAAMTVLVSDYPDSTYANAVQLAAIIGDDEAIRRLATSGAALDEVGIAKHTALSLAATFDRVSAAATLIELGANVEGVPGTSAIPLLTAASLGHEEIVELLVANGADVMRQFDNVDDDRIVFLALIASSGSTSLLTRMIDEHPAILERDGAAALNVAAAAGNGENFQALLDAGALIEDAHFEREHLLVSAVAGTDPSIIRTVIAAGRDRELKADYGFGALSAAAIYGRAEIVQLLIDEGMATESAERPSATLMHMASMMGSVDVARILLDAGIPVDAPHEVTGITPAMTGADLGRYEFVRFLIEEGANPNRLVEDDLSLLAKAASDGATAAVRAMLAAGADLDFGPPEATPPIVGAIAGGHIETLQLLIDAGAPINGPIYRGYDALLIALYADNYEIVRALSEAGAEPSGETANLEGWRRNKVRRFLQDRGFERLTGTDDEVWERQNEDAAATRVTLPPVRGRYPFEQLVEVVRQSGIEVNEWLAE